MSLSTYLDALSSKELDPAALEGGIAFLALDRPVDRLIQLALGLGPYHPGKESPWSHTVLIAEPYHGATTKILDCTIRSDDGKIAWKESVFDVLSRGIANCGGIYEGTVSDYDDPRVTAFGLKVLQDLTAADRKLIVTAGCALRTMGYHYDVPGLVRELTRLFLDVPLRAGDKLLFCSAFCQSAYRNGVGMRGDFAPAIRTEDVTPDDLWYSSLGTGFLPS